VSGGDVGEGVSVMVSICKGGWKEEGEGRRGVAWTCGADGFEVVECSFFM
jgi:hypothetical protein